MQTVLATQNSLPPHAGPSDMPVPPVPSSPAEIYHTRHSADEAPAQLPGSHQAEPICIAQHSPEMSPWLAFCSPTADPVNPDRVKLYMHQPLQRILMAAWILICTTNYKVCTYRAPVCISEALRSRVSCRKSLTCNFVQPKMTRSEQVPAGLHPC